MVTKSVPLLIRNFDYRSIFGISYIDMDSGES